MNDLERHFATSPIPWVAYLIELVEGCKEEAAEAVRELGAAGGQSSVFDFQVRIAANMMWRAVEAGDFWMFCSGERLSKK